MHTKKELDQRLHEAGVQPLNKLGQNFLVNPTICDCINRAVTSFSPNTIIEIGPGLGALTDELLNLNSKLILVEVDSGLTKYWKTRHPDLEVLHQDALRVKWSELNVEKPCVIVSNLPYSIAASIVVELSVSEFGPEALILMFQKEVAQRITAPLGSSNYGLLSVIAQVHWEISNLIDAGPQDFFPVPNVGSRVLEFKPRPCAHDRQRFLKFVKIAFQQRRKKLFSNLSASYKKPQIQEAFDHLGLKEMARAQELDTKTFENLFKFLEKS